MVSFFGSHPSFNIVMMAPKQTHLMVGLASHHPLEVQLIQENLISFATELGMLSKFQDQLLPRPARCRAQHRGMPPHLHRQATATMVDHLCICRVCDHASQLLDRVIGQVALKRVVIMGFRVEKL
jgi:hypothetical protein